jgi:hypothetical protein
MIEPTTEEIKNMVSMSEEWWKDHKGDVWVRRHINFVTHSVLLGKYLTPFREVPFADWEDF